MPAEKFTTTLVPFEVKPFYNGVNRRTHQEYTIYQVRARDMKGQEITAFPLRSFEDLKLHEPIEVECQLYDGGQQYGISYTVKQVAKTNSDKARLEALEQQVAHLYAHLNLAGPSPRSTPAPAQATPPPASPPGPPTGPPPPAPTPVSAPPAAPAVPQTQVAASQPVQPEPGSQYGDEAPF